MASKRVRFQNDQPEAIPPDPTRAYTDVVLYNNDAMIRQIDKMRQMALLSPLFTKEHRQRVLHYINTCAIVDANTESVSSVTPKGADGSSSSS